jgi:hypothetical protein
MRHQLQRQQEPELQNKENFHQLLKHNLFLFFLHVNLKVLLHSLNPLRQQIFQLLLVFQYQQLFVFQKTFHFQRTPFLVCET